MEKALNPKRAVPVLLVIFLFSLIIDNGFKFMSMPIAQDLNLDPTTVSLQATLAGIIVGIGAVVYAALADVISIRKLLLVGISMIGVGSLIGFFGQNYFSLVLIGRIIQTTGLAAAETLYVIYVTKHLSDKDQKTYLGFSTSAFQLSMLFGTLTGGFIATYVSWTAMFLVALLACIAVPFVIRTVPKTMASDGSVDVIGLLLVAAIATSVIMFMQEYKLRYLVAFGLAAVLFGAHVNMSTKALVRPEFFTNGRYVWAIVVVLIMYSTQLSMTFLFPFALNALHGWELDNASLLFAPGYVAGAIVGACSGLIAKALSSRQTIILALSLIIGALVMSALFIDGHALVLGLAVVLFSSGFAAMYAPLVSSALSTIPAEKSGVAIGFYNLSINIAIPVGIAYTASLMDALPKDAFGSAMVMWIVALIALVGAVVYILSDLMLTRREKLRASVV